jgi:hypothetical protein
VTIHAGLTRRRIRWIQARGSVIVVGFLVLPSLGTPTYNVPFNVLSSNGVSYTVPATVLGSGGNSYSPIPNSYNALSSNATLYSVSLAVLNSNSTLNNIKTNALVAKGGVYTPVPIYGFPTLSNGNYIARENGSGDIRLG